MAIYSASDSNYLSRASIVGANTPFSMCFWARPGTTSSWKCPASLDTSSNQLYFYFEQDDAGHWQFYYQTIGSNESGSIDLGTYSANVWYFLGFSWAPTTQYRAIRRAFGETVFTFGTDTTSGAGTNALNLVVGRTRSFTGEYFSGRVAHVKVWNAQLSQAELEAEYASVFPRRRTNLVGWYPLVHSSVADCLRDFSTNGNNLTQTGTPTIQDGPPIPWNSAIIIPGVGGAATYSLAGVTKDDAGSPLGSCDVFLWKRSGNSLTFVQFTTSDGSGNYSFTGLADTDSAYLVTAYKSGSPNRMDSTDWVLTPS